MIDYQKLNEAIDKEIKMYNKTISYNFIEYITRRVTLESKTPTISPIQPIIFLTREDIIKYALEFFKLIDEELYQEVLELIENRKIDRVIFLYPIDEVKNKNECPYVEETDTEAIVNVPLRTEIKYETDKLKNKNPTIEDLYIIVHEIAHTLDLDLKNSRNWKRNLYVEVASISCEMLLDKLMKEKMPQNAKILDRITQCRIFNSKMNAEIAFTKINLVKIRAKKGKITQEDIEEYQDAYGIKSDAMEDLIRQIIYSKTNVVHETRYVLGTLIATTLEKKYNENPREAIQALVKYMKSMKEDNDIEAFQALGIDFSEENMNNMISNLNEKVEKLETYKKEYKSPFLK